MKTTTLLRLALAALLPAAGCANQGSPPPDPAPQPSVAPISSAERGELEATLHELYRGTSLSRLEIAYAGDLLQLPEGWTVDLQAGSGHGGGLILVRLESRGDRVAVEEVVWEGGGQQGPPGPGRARRAVVPLDSLRTFLVALRHVPALELSETFTQPPDADPNTRVASGWHSSNDFSLQVRVFEPDHTSRFERSYTGYANSSDQLNYLPVEAAWAALQRDLPETQGWTEVPGAELRTTHFASAFVRSREHLRQGSAWWVRDRAVAALGTFGRPEVLVALRELTSAERNSTHVATRIEQILADPDRWLSGAPKRFAE